MAIKFSAKKNPPRKWKNFNFFFPQLFRLFVWSCLNCVCTFAEFSVCSDFLAEQKTTFIVPWANLVVPPDTFSFNITFLKRTSHFFSSLSLCLSLSLLVVLFATTAAVCHKVSIIWFNIIVKVGFPTDTIYIKNQRNRSTAIKSFIGFWKWRKFF